MPRDEKLSALTRSLILGASISTLALAGCVTQEQADVQVAQIVQTLPASEAALCQRANAHKDPRTVSTFLRRYPQSRCVVPLLNSLPAETISNLSPRAVAALSDETRARLSPRVTSNLPAARTARAAPAAPAQRTTRAAPAPAAQRAPARQQQPRRQAPRREAGFQQFY